MTLTIREEVDPHVQQDEMKLGAGKSKYCGNSMRSSSQKGYGSIQGNLDQEENV